MTPGWLDGAVRGRNAWWLAGLLALIVLAAHLPFLASTLEDIDSINFALGVRDFDPAQHRPHPPGYPVYIALAKLARLAMSEPHALAVWPAIFGALAVFPLLLVFSALDFLGGSVVTARGEADRPWPVPAALATVVTVTAPLYWMLALRPLSDMVGLAFALAAQAALATALLRQARDIPDRRGAYDAQAAARSGRLILLGAFLAAVGIGVRSQTVWLTAPLLTGVVVSRIGRGAAGAAIGSVVWFTAGILLWLVPLTVASGGPSAYLAAFGAQAAEDWTGVDLLVTRFSVRRLAFGLHDTLIVPWPGLGWLLLAAAVAGAAAMLWRSRRAFVVLLVAYAPYFVFHLFFQESFTTRYALPLVPPLAYLAVRGVWLLGRTPAAITVGLCALTALAQTVPVAARYSAEGSPVSRAIADVEAEAGRHGFLALGRYHPFARAIEADLDAAAIHVLSAQPRYGVSALIEHIVKDGRGPVWFFSSPLHRDLVRIDPHAQVLRRSYRWGFPSDPFLGHVRPGDVDWIEIRNPGWATGEGWHLTPETAGLAVASGTGLGSGPIAAQVRTRPGATRVLVGGRHLGRAGDPDLAFALSVGERVVDRWSVSAASPFFLRFVDLPAGTLAAPGPWMPLTVEARRTDTLAFSPLGAVEQFNLQDDSTPMAGYGAGWHENEFTPKTGVLWRWTSQRAELDIRPLTGNLHLDITGESPVRDHPRPSAVTVRAGPLTVLKQAVSGEFAWSVHVPAEALAASGGIVTIETDQVFRPADRGENADRRALGLRVFRVAVRPAS